MTFERRLERVALVALSPVVLLVSALIGLFVAFEIRPLALALQGFSTLYLRLLGLTVAPIIFSAIAAAVGRLAARNEAATLLRKGAVLLPLSMIATGICGTAFGVLSGVGTHLPQDVRATLGATVRSNVETLALPIQGGVAPAQAEPRAFGMVEMFVPANVYAALAKDDVLKILVGGLAFGLTLGLLKHQAKHEVFLLFDGVFQGFNRLVDVLICALPVELVCMIASHFAQLDREMLGAMGVFAACTNLMLLGAVALALFWMSVRGRTSLRAVAKAQREPLFLAFATRSAFSCLPSAMQSLVELQYERSEVELVVPLAVTLGRFGSIAYFSIAAVFAANLYGGTIAPEVFATIVLLSVVAGLATAGGGGFAGLSLVSITLDAIGVPSESIVVVLVAVDAVVNPLRTVTTVAVGTAFAATLVRSEAQGESARVPRPARRSAGRARER